MKILLSHGSPDPAHRQAVEELAHRVEDTLGETVEAAFLGDALPKGADVLPMFLIEGGHLLKDVPEMIAASGARLIKGPAAFPDDMAGMAIDLAVAKRLKQRAVMFALYRLPGAQSLMAPMYTLSRKFPLPAIAALHGQCDVASVLRLWGGEGVKQALIQPLLLFPGKSLDQLKQCAEGMAMDIVVGRPLTEHPDFPLWLAERFREAA